jgi:hypothetical protein
MGLGAFGGIDHPILVLGETIGLVRSPVYFPWVFLHKELLSENNRKMTKVPATSGPFNSAYWHFITPMPLFMCPKIEFAY